MSNDKLDFFDAISVRLLQFLKFPIYVPLFSLEKLKKNCRSLLNFFLLFIFFFCFFFFRFDWFHCSAQPQFFEFRWISSYVLIEPFYIYVDVFCTHLFLHTVKSRAAEDLAGIFFFLFLWNVCPAKSALISCQSWQTADWRSKIVRFQVSVY